MRDNSVSDKGMEKLIAGKLRAQLKAESKDCPEAETLAAYVDQTLTRGERDSLQPHLASCSRCQEQVAELVRLSVAEEGTKVLVAAPAPARRIAWFRWALAAPELVALVVGALWYTGEFRPLLRQQEQLALKTPPARAVPTAPAELKEGQVSTSPALRQLGAKAQPARKAKAEMVSALPPAAPKPSAAGAGTSGAAVAGGGVAGENVASAGQGAIATPSDRARLVTPAPVAGRAEKSVSVVHEDRLAFRAEVPPPLAAAPALEPEREKTSQQEAVAPSKPTPKEAEALGFLTRGVVTKKVMARSPAGIWRVGRRGLIQKAGANGNWVTQASGVEANLLDIVFSTPNVGWAVGEAGTVLRTTDGGTTWSKVSIPTRADLIRVTASGELAARVVTRDGQTLATSDGGKSWSAIPQD